MYAVQLTRQKRRKGRCTSVENSEVQNLNTWRLCSSMVSSREANIKDCNEWGLIFHNWMHKWAARNCYWISSERVALLNAVQLSHLLSRSKCFMWLAQLLQIGLHEQAAAAAAAALRSSSSSSVEVVDSLFRLMTTQRFYFLGLQNLFGFQYVNLLYYCNSPQRSARKRRFAHAS